MHVLQYVQVLDIKMHSSPNSESGKRTFPNITVSMSKGTPIKHESKEGYLFHCRGYNFWNGLSGVTMSKANHLCIRVLLQVCIPSSSNLKQHKPNSKTLQVSVFNPQVNVNELIMI